jgi:hypothetical protein
LFTKTLILATLLKLKYLLFIMINLFLNLKMNFSLLLKKKKNSLKLTPHGEMDNFHLILQGALTALNTPKLPGTKKLNLLKNLMNLEINLKPFSQESIFLLIKKNPNIMNNLMSTFLLLTTKNQTLLLPI